MADNDPLRSQESSQGAGNRPAQGARRGKPSDLDAEFEGLGGADFLGLSEDLAQPQGSFGYAQPPSSPYAGEYGAGQPLHMAEPVSDVPASAPYRPAPAPKQRATAWASEDVEGFTEVGDPLTLGSKSRRPGLGVAALVLVLVGGGIVAADYRGWLPLGVVPDLLRPDAGGEELAQAPRPAGPRTSAERSGAGDQAGPDEVSDELAGASEAEDIEDSRDLTALLHQTRAEPSGPDPLLQRLSSEGGSTAQVQGADGEFRPFGIIAGWVQAGLMAGAAGSASMAAGPRTGGQAADGVQDPLARTGPAGVGEGLVDLSDFPDAPAAEHLALMDVVWRGDEVPMELISSMAKIWTPQVGPVRLTADSGEVFDGRLVAVGKRRVWIVASAGEMALDAGTLHKIERMPEGPGGPENPTPIAAASGQRVKARAAGGNFVGRVLSVKGEQVTLVTDTGARITLKAPAMEQITEGISVKLKSHD